MDDGVLAVKVIDPVHRPGRFFHVTISALDRFLRESPRSFNAKSWSSMTWMRSGYLYFIAVGKPTGHREFDVHSRWKPTREAEEKRRRRRRRNEDEDKGMHVFWTWAPFFWTCTCFLDLAGFFLDLGAQKMWGMRLCVFWTLRGYFFFDLHAFVRDPGTFF